MSADTVPMLVVTGFELVPKLPPAATRFKELPDIDPDDCMIEPVPTWLRKILPLVPFVELDVMLPLSVMPVEPELIKSTV